MGFFFVFALVHICDIISADPVSKIQCIKETLHTKCHTIYTVQYTIMIHKNNYHTNVILILYERYTRFQLFFKDSHNKQQLIVLLHGFL